MTSMDDYNAICLMIEQSNKECQQIKRKSHWLEAIMALLLIVSSSLNIYQCSTGSGKVETFTDTITIVTHDTMLVSQPTEVVRYVVRKDTVFTTDIVYIEDTTGKPAYIVPIEQTIYHDSTENASYNAYISGYHAALDSISILCTNKETIITRIEKEKASRFGVGIQFGVGMSAQGIAAPYLGIGVQYRLLGK